MNSIYVLAGLLLRHVLTFAGGAAGYIGAIDGNTIQLAVGAVSTLVGIGLSIYNKTGTPTATPPAANTTPTA
jgi:hypothetical protein